MNLEEVFSSKINENGDISFTKVGDDTLLNILFLTEYYQNHLDELPKLGNSIKEQIFAMFVRDCRFGLGRRDLGRKLLSATDCSLEQIVMCGRVDDLFSTFSSNTDEWFKMLDWCKEEISKGNELVKKWMPRYSSKNLLLAREIAKYWGMNKQQYGHFIKCNTIENKMSSHNFDNIVFEHIPSLAMIKYSYCFEHKKELCDRYKDYLNDVRSGKKELKIATTSIYDIYKNRKNIDADLYFSKIEKISINCIPIVDTSGSMMDSNDSYGKAVAIGHYLSKCSTYCPNKVVSFSSRPQLLSLGENKSYEEELKAMYTGDCTNTDFGAVMRLLSNLDEDLPNYLVVLSDMEFDEGSKLSKDETMKLFKSKGYNTKIIWWNLNSRNITCPEMDKDGNIFMSGYNPMLLKYLQVGFNGMEFLNILLQEYVKQINCTKFLP